MLDRPSRLRDRFPHLGDRERGTHLAETEQNLLRRLLLLMVAGYGPRLERVANRLERQARGGWPSIAGRIG